MKQPPNFLHRLFTNRLFSALLLSGCYISVFSQAASPYSRYGLGFLRTPVFSSNKGMGEVAAPYAGALSINYANPASYASMLRTTIEVGANFNEVTLRTRNDSVYNTGNGGLNHLALAFVPKPDKWAVSIGLLPYSNINYNFVQNFNDSALGAYRYVYTGSGSLYQVYAGGAYKIKSRINERDQFSIGVNLGYIFGKLRYQKFITFPDTALAYSASNLTDINYKGFNYTIGLQYSRKIYHSQTAPDERTDIYMTIGATASGGIDLNTKLNNYWARVNFTPTSSTLIDTTEATFDQKGKATMPVNMSAGVMFGNERFWMLGADFRYSNWSRFSSPLNNDQLGDSWRVNMGFQITPSYVDRKYFNRVQYRLGGYYGNSEVLYQGTNMREAGGTVGFGFPFRLFPRSSTMLNIAADLGTRNHSNQNAISETYYRFTFGLVLNDADWFRKRRFD